MSRRVIVIAVAILVAGAAALGRAGGAKGPLIIPVLAPVASTNAQPRAVAREGISILERSRLQRHRRSRSAHRGRHQRGGRAGGGPAVDRTRALQPRRPTLSWHGLRAVTDRGVVDLSNGHTIWRPLLATPMSSTQSARPRSDDVVVTVGDNEVVVRSDGSAIWLWAAFQPLGLPCSQLSYVLPLDRVIILC